ncbi:MAG TPA: hypothetical protein VLG12_06695 [Candidatus Saccharimonadales bacterium]|nr:hypothetical protein [Candidatus Saccharimonadales bacterium]
MLSLTAPFNIMTLPSLPSIHIDSKVFSMAKIYSFKTVEKIMGNKYISAFTSILGGPV